MNRVKENIEKILSNFVQTPINTEVNYSNILPDNVQTEPRRPSLVNKIEKFKTRCLGYSIKTTNIEQNKNSKLIKKENIIKHDLTSICQKDQQILIDVLHTPPGTNINGKFKNFENNTVVDFNIYIKMLIHELRTPLSTISMGLSILEKDIQSNESKYIIKDLNESIVFIENIFSKFIIIQDGNIKLNTFETFSLDELLQNVINILHYHIHVEDVWIEYKIHADVADVNYGDKYNIKHCIINVVKNAIKYRNVTHKSFIIIDIKHINNPKLQLQLHTVLPEEKSFFIQSDESAVKSSQNSQPDSGELSYFSKPRVPTSFPSKNKPNHYGRNVISLPENGEQLPPNCDIIYEKIKRKKQTIQIIICDNNNHILPHIKEHLFESFNSTSGSGLGLYICKSIVELHGGTIIHEYISPIGNKFIITLPLAVYEKKFI